MLLDSIGTIFDQGLSNWLGRFLVRDGGTGRDGLRVVLLLESPHSDEVCPPAIDDRFPLAGGTGRCVRELLRRDLPNQAVGQLVHDDHPELLTLGIMNVSRLPFQGVAYDACNNQHWSSYIRCMECIRKRPYVHNYRGFRDAPNLRAELNDLQNAIAEDLSARLTSLFNRQSDVELVRCGDVAESFYAKAYMADTYLPHPSTGGWSALNQEQERRLQRIINRLRPQTGP